jgi:hypothetical protein
MRKFSAVLYNVWYWAVIIFGIVICLAALIGIIQNHGNVISWINNA